MREILNGHNITLVEAQGIQTHWETGCGVPRDWLSRAERLAEEQAEFWEACYTLQLEDTSDNRKALALETIDMMIIQLAVIDTLGYNASELFKEKILINYLKYQPEVVQELIASGMSNEEAMAECKRRWNDRGQGVEP